MWILGSWTHHKGAGCETSKCAWVNGQVSIFQKGKADQTIRYWLLSQSTKMMLMFVAWSWVSHDSRSCFLLYGGSWETVMFVFGSSWGQGVYIAGSSCSLATGAKSGLENQTVSSLGLSTATWLVVPLNCWNCLWQTFGLDQKCCQ